jgi:hypothetical protein
MKAALLRSLENIEIKRALWANFYAALKAVLCENPWRTKQAKLGSAERGNALTSNQTPFS